MHRLTAEFWRVRLGEDALRWADAAARLVNGEVPEWIRQAGELGELSPPAATGPRAVAACGNLPCRRPPVRSDRRLRAFARRHPRRSRLPENRRGDPRKAGAGECEPATSLNNLAEMQKALREDDPALDALERARKIQEHLPEDRPAPSELCAHPQQYRRCASGAKGVRAGRTTYSRSARHRPRRARTGSPEHRRSPRQSRRRSTPSGRRSAKGPSGLRISRRKTNTSPPPSPHTEGARGMAPADGHAPKQRSAAARETRASRRGDRLHAPGRSAPPRHARTGASRDDRKPARTVRDGAESGGHLRPPRPRCPVPSGAPAVG